MINLIFISVMFCYIYEDSDSLIVSNDTLTICGTHQYNIKVDVSNLGILKVRQWSGAADSFGQLVLNAPLIILEDSSLINGSELGYKGGDMNTHPQGYGPGGGGAGHVNGGGGGGAGYGGDGGDGGDFYPGTGGSAYGDPTDTLIDIGSGGGAGRYTSLDGTGGRGGARIYLLGQKIVIDSSFIESNGEIGDPGQFGLEAGGGGSGGGIMLWSDTVMIYSSTIHASGGDGGSAAYGGGGGAGGGRIKVFYGSLLDTSLIDLLVQEGEGGIGTQGTNGEDGVPGSIFIDRIVDVTEIAGITTRESLIYSNPTRGIATIICKNVPIQLRLYDITGRVVKVLWIENQTETLDLHDLHQGIYFIRYRHDRRILGKLIILK